jgi:hypothetical protein
MKGRPTSLHLLLLLALSLAVQSAFSQDSTSSRTLGISASFQGSQVDLLLPIWVGKNTVLAPSVGVTYAEAVATDLHIGLAPRLYLSQKSKVCPFIGLRIGMLCAIPASTGNGIIDWLVGLAAGGEYFFDDHLSFGAEAQLNFAFSDRSSLRFGNPGRTNINTAAALFATVYF